MTIESTLGNSGNIGTGIDFNNYNGSSEYWMTEYYNSFNDIQLEPATNTTTGKNTRTYVGTTDATGRQTSMYANPAPKPVLYSNFGLMERSLGINKLESETTLSRTKAPMRFRSRSINTFADGLEIGDNLAGNALRAGNGWEDVDPSKSEGRRTGDLSKNGFASTRITEINKGTKRFRQEFTFYQYQYGAKNRTIEIHRQPELYDLNLSDSNIRVYQLVNGVKQEITNVKFTNKRVNGKNRFVSGNIGTNIKGTLIVEVETSYNPSFGIGLGSDYNNNTVAQYDNKAWVADSYSNEEGINKNVTQEKTYNITPNSPSNGKLEISKTSGIKQGEQVTITVTPNNGYVLDTLKVDEQNVSVNGQGQYVLTMPNHDVNVSASFKEKPQAPTKHKIYTQTPSNGTFKVDKTEAAEGEEVTITPSPAEGYKVKEIYVGSANGQVQVNNNKFTMPNSDVSIRVDFEQITQPQPSEFNINIIKKDGGTVTTDVSTAKKGGTVKINITPDQGWQIESMNVVGKNGGSVATVNQQAKTFTMPAEDVWVQVTFKQIPTKSFYVGSEPHSWGTVSVDPTESRNQYAKVGEKVTFTLNPYQGYKATGATVTKNKGGLVDVEFDPTTNKGYFIMPDISPSDAVTVRGVFKPLPAGTRYETKQIEETLKHEVETTVDESLAPGEKVVDQKGSDGRVTYNYKITIEKGTEADAAYPADWPQNLLATFQGMKQTGERIAAYNRTEVEGSRINPTVEKVRVGKSDDPIDKFVPTDEDKLIKNGETQELVKITNKKAGITPKILKRSPGGEILPGATFTLNKMTDSTYSKIDTGFGTLTATSDEKGDVVFKNGAGNVVKLQKGYYVVKETKAPTGYKKSTADWKIEVKDDGGRMYAEYQGPESSPSSFINDNKKSNAGYSADNAGIKYKSRLTFIDTESKTYIQRIYIDTRAYSGTSPLNLQITPKYKREEKDAPGQHPETIKDGVKTAYFTAYKLSNPSDFSNMNDPKLDKILRTYDLSNPDLSMIKTARWRPFDWGFDEDQLNLDKGVYIVDVEGFYDDVIITGKSDKTDKYNIPQEDLGKIDLHVDFYEGARQF